MTANLPADPEEWCHRDLVEEVRRLRGASAWRDIATAPRGSGETVSPDLATAKRCSKPGCGALAAAPCLDADCPQQWVSYRDHIAALTTAEARLSDALSVIDGKNNDIEHANAERLAAEAARRDAEREAECAELDRESTSLQLGAAYFEIGKLQTRIAELEAALTQCIGPLKYAFDHVSSPTADRVKREVIPAAERALSSRREEGTNG